MKRSPEDICGDYQSPKVSSFRGRREEMPSKRLLFDELKRQVWPPDSEKASHEQAVSSRAVSGSNDREHQEEQKQCDDER